MKKQKGLIQKKTKDSKWLVLISIGLAFLFDLVVIIALLTDGQALYGKVPVIIIPCVLLFADIAFFVISLLTNFRFKYGRKSAGIYFLIIVTLSVAMLLIIEWLPGIRIYTLVAQILWIGGHFVTGIACLISAFAARNSAGSTFKNNFSAVLSLACAVAILVGILYYGASFIVNDGYFGQGGKEECTLIYKEENGGYSVVGIVEGKGNSITVPKQFNGKDIVSVDCAVFSEECVRYVDLMCSSEVRFDNMEKLTEVASRIDIGVTKEEVSGFKQKFLELSKAPGGEKFAEVANSFTPTDIDENEVYLLIDYTADQLDFLESSYPIIWYGEKGDVFNIKEMKDDEGKYYSFLTDCDKKQEINLYNAYKNFDRNIFDGIVVDYSDDERGTSLSADDPAFKVNKTGHVSLKFDRIYKIQFGYDNDTVFENERYKKFSGEDGRYVVKSTADELIGNYGERAGFILRWEYGKYGDMIGKKDFTELSEIISGFTDDTYVYPRWELKKPIINSATVNGETNANAVYGDDIDFEYSANVYDDVKELNYSIGYEWYKNGKVVMSNNKVKSRFLPSDSGEYTLKITLTASETSLVSEATKTVSLTVGKKQMNFDWIIPEGENAVYSAAEKEIRCRYDYTDKAYEEDEIDFYITKDINDDNTEDAKAIYCLNAGHYTAYLNLKGDWTQLYEVPELQMSIEFDIYPRGLAVTWTENVDYVYNGSEQGPEGAVTPIGSDEVGFSISDNKKTNAGDYFATASITNTNYFLTNPQKEYEIRRREITVNANDKEKIYGDALPEFDWKYAAGSNEFIAADEIELSLTSVVTVTSRVGGYDITFNEPELNNYSVTYNKGTLTVNKRAITVSIDDKNSVYGFETEVLTASVTSGNIVNGDENVYSLSIDNYGAGHVNTYVISGSTVNTDYEITFINGEYTITKRYVTVKADDKAKTYGDELPAFTWSYEVGSYEFLPADNVDFVLKTEAVRLSYVGSYDIELTEREDLSDYEITYGKGTLIVNNRHVTVKADNKEKTYGDELPAFTWSYVGSAIFVDEDNVELSFETAATSFSDVNDYDISIVERNIPNYVVTYQKGTLKVNKRAVAVKADDRVKTYGDGAPAFGWSYEDGSRSFLTEDNIDFDLTTTATVTSGVGGYDITFNEPELNNYSVTYKKGTLTVNKRGITVSIDDKNSVYGFETEVLTASVTSGNIVNGDENVYSLGIDNYGEGHVNTYVISGSTVNTDYEITFINGEYTVTKRDVTIKAKNVAPYYGDNFTLSFEYEGENQLLSADVNKIECVCSAKRYSDVGTYDINVKAKEGADLSDYDITYKDGTLTINKRTVKIKPTNTIMVYGNEVPDITWTYQSGSKTFVAKDGISFDVETTATSASPKGNYDITIVERDESSLPSLKNYNVEYSKGTLTVNARPITVSIDDKTSVYGSETEELTGRVTSGNIVNGDTDAYSLKIDNFGAGHVKTYTISGEANSANYSVSFANNGTYTVTKRPVSIKADDKAMSYGDGLPELDWSYGDGSYEFLPADEITFTLTANATSASVAGSYDIIIDQKDLADYTVSYQKGTLTVNRRAITVTIANKSSVYGAPLAGLSSEVTSGSIVNGDDVYDIYILDIGEADVGEYPIKGTAKNSNYDVTFIDGTYSVTNGEATVPAADETVFIYNGNEQTYNITDSDVYIISGNKRTGAGSYTVTVSLKDKENYKWNDDTTNDKTYTFVINKATVNIPDADETVFTYDMTEHTYVIEESGLYDISGNKRTDAGNYTVTVSLTDKNNYKWSDETISDKEFSFVVNTITVNVKADNKEIGYGDDIPVLTWSYASGSNEFFEADEVILNISTTATNESNAGEYPITFPEQNVSNYSVNYTSGTLIINKIAVAVPEADETVFTYNGNEQTYTLEENELYEISGNKETDAGNHTVIVSLNDKVNYKWTDGTSGDKEYEFIISQAENGISELSIEGWTEGENANEPSATSLFGGIVYTYLDENEEYLSDSAPTVAGTYYVKATVAETDNYAGAEDTIQFTIAEAE